MIVRIDAREAYLLFLQSDWWRSLRMACLESAGFRCQGCGSGKRLQAHHVTYRENWFDTRQEDLRCLCNRCHSHVHDKDTNWRPKPKLGRKKRLERQRASRIEKVFKRKRRPHWHSYGTSSN